MSASGTTICIDSIRLNPKSDVTKAFCSVTFQLPDGRVTIHNVRYIEPAGKPPFVSCPDQKRDDTYYAVARIAGDLRERVFKHVQHAYNRKLEEYNRNLPESSTAAAARGYAQDHAAASMRSNPEITDDDIPF